jgi:hypothetical protein
VAGVTPQQWGYLSERILNVSAYDLNLACDFDPILALTSINLARNLTHIDLARIDLDLDLDLALNLELSRDFKFSNDFNFSMTLILARDRALSRTLDHDRTRTLIRKRNGKTSTTDETRPFLLMLTALWYLFSRTYLEAAQKKRMFWTKTSKSKYYKAKSQKYAQKWDAALHLYIFVVLVNERQAGNLPTWEGIRIVRERIEG